MILTAITASNSPEGERLIPDKLVDVWAIYHAP
jgi:hypothetical protein